MNKCLFVINLLLVLVTIISSCHKNKIDPACGCDSDSVWHYSTYNNFGGFRYNAWLNYVTENNQNAWFIGVNVPGINYSAILKICNPDKGAIRAFTDTSNRKYPIPVKIVGALKRICANENQSFGFTVLPETLCAYIMIDSLQK